MKLDPAIGAGFIVCLCCASWSRRRFKFSGETDVIVPTSGNSVAFG